MEQQLYGFLACASLALALCLLLVLPTHFLTYILAGSALRVTGALACRLPGNTMHALGRCYLSLSSALTLRAIWARD